MELGKSVSYLVWDSVKVPVWGVLSVSFAQFIYDSTRNSIWLPFARSVSNIKHLK